MRKVTFFIPHYSDHERLKFQLSLAEKIYNFPRNYVIYDSSPLPIGEKEIKNCLNGTDYIYRVCRYEKCVNTYNYVVRDFMLSNDSKNGAFIMPHDELLIINYDNFRKLPPSMPFSCGNQLAFCPTSKKIAEYSLSISHGINASANNAKGKYVPQYHSTYFPPNLMLPLGNLFKEFLDRFGEKHGSFVGFVQFDILARLDMFYCSQSVYIQERLIKRKTAGQYSHPSFFIHSLDAKDRLWLKELVINTWKDIDILSSEHSESSLNNLFNPSYLQKSLFMLENDRHKYLFEYYPNPVKNIAFNRIDIFCGYHVLGTNVTQSTIRDLFESSSCLSLDNSLNCLFQMINSYEK